MASALIELENISMSFGADEEVLTKVSLSIHEGENFVIVGPSGQGKSLLLKIMGGIQPPTEGRVLIEGKDLYGLPRDEQKKLMRRMGMLFQKNALFDSLTCGENISFPMKEILNSTDQEAAEKIEYFLEAVAIPHARDLYPDEISGGMQKRLGIARALALDPEIIFYDDPTAGLDPITSRRIIELILELQKKRGSTAISITNDMNRAFQMADRMAMVVDHNVILTGTPEQTKACTDKRVQQFINGNLEGPLTT